MKTIFTKKITQTLLNTLKAGVVTLALVFFVNTEAKAQELEFSQVLMLTDNTATCTTCWTVPAGKVW